MDNIKALVLLKKCNKKDTLLFSGLFGLIQYLSVMHKQCIIAGASYIAIKSKQTRIIKFKKEIGINCIYKSKETSQTS